MTRAAGIDIPGEPRRPWHVSVVAETGSTNDDLLRAAERGELDDRVVLRTDHQTAGRGRVDRRWDAPPGSNLLASIYLAEPGDRPAEAVQRIGVAIVEAVSRLASERVAGEGRPAGAHDAIEGRAELGIKWPNDVLISGRKLAGILAQRSTAAPGLVIGFGVNVGWAPAGAGQVAEVSSCRVADVLDAILSAFDALPTDQAAFAEMYRSRLITLGKSVRVHLPGDVSFDGTAVDIDADGRIIVQPVMGEARTFDVGDVVHLRPGPEGTGPPN